jgi:HlyD family secretion protein
LEATEADVSAKIAGRVAALYVQEGQQVRRGQVLAALESPEIEAKLRQAAAAREAAAAQQKKADRGAREEEIRQAYTCGSAPRTAPPWRKRPSDGSTASLRTGSSPQRRDEAETQWRTSLSQAEAAKAGYDMALKGARGEDREAAEALVRQATGLVAEVEAFRAETKLYAGMDGEVRR